MKKENLENLTLHELCDLLVDNTIRLLEAMEKRSIGSRYGIKKGT